VGSAPESNEVRAADHCSSHKLTNPLCHIINKFASGGTRLGRQVGRRGLYLNDYWSQLLPWSQDKYDKAKYFVTGTAMSR
jgi:amidase